MTIDPKHVKDIFLEAADLPDEAARSAYLDKACGGDAELRARVEALLRSHDPEGSFLGTPLVSPPDPDHLATRTFSPEPSHAPTRAGGGEAATADDEVSLGFLEPATRPDSLGRIGHYEVLQVLGQGGFGIVLRALDDVLHRVVAVKVLSPQMAATSPARKRFLREARSSAQVRHENVVQVYEVGEQPLPYIAMEFIPGETLQQRLDRTGPVDVAEVVRIGRQVAEGLAAAHATDLIHRDIKPGNILLEGGQLRVKITDFGLARAADDASLSQSGLVAGTPMYMAPEQARGETLDQRADLFSLGSVLYVMAAGRPPFRANGTLAVLERVAYHAPRPIREITPETPQWLCDIIAKLHAKNPDDRFQSARELADVLADCETQLGANGRVKDFSRIPASKPAAAPSVRSRRWIWAAVAFVLLAALGVWFGRAGVLSLRNKGELEILPEQGLVSVIVLQNDDGVIDGNKLHAPASDWLDMKQRQALTLTPGRYQLNVGTWPAGSAVAQWEVTDSGLFGSSVVTVPVVLTSAIITLQRGHVVTLRPKMRPAPVDRADTSTKDTALPATDPDRRAAEYLLSNGGTIKVNDREQEIRAVTDLPRGPFRLTSVDIRGPQVNDEGMANFKGCKNLVHISLAVNELVEVGRVTDAGLAYFKDCKNLTSLTLDSSNITDAGLAYFEDCKNLRSLSLSSHALTGAGLLHFQECKNLTSLSVNSSAFKDEALAHIGGLNNLTHLSLYMTGITDAGLVHLESCTNLTHLNLPNAKITGAGLVHFKGYAKLTHLDLSSTKIADAGLVHLQNCKDLLDLNLSGTKVGDAGIAAFRDFEKLESLTLADTQVGDVGLAQLKDCKGLKVLGLRGSKVTDAGLASLKNLKGLTSLGLWMTRVTDAGLADIAGLENLTVLNLNSTKVTARGVRGLAKLLPRCNITWDDGEIGPNNGPDRRAAVYVLWLGGEVQVEIDGASCEIKAQDELPRTAFRLTRVRLGDNLQLKDAGLEPFNGCQNLSVLDLTDTLVTDAGLVHLAGLDGLTDLLLARTKVSTEGVELLTKELPMCRITWDGGVTGPK